MKRTNKFTVTALAVVAMGFMLIGCKDTTKPDLKAPSAPTGLVSTSKTETSITVEWNAVKGADKYRVYAGTTAANLTLKGSPTSTSYLIDGLFANTTYYIAVSAENEAGQGEKSVTINVTTSQIPKPQAPTGLAAGTVTSNSIAITWNSISGVSGYTVYAGTTSGNMTQRGTPTTASYTITGLTANTTYYIAVSASNASGEGNRSSTITATTSASGNEPNIPSVPTGVTAAALSSNSISVSWSAVSGVTSYDVYYEIGFSSTKNFAGNTTSTSYTHTGLQPSTTYYYFIKAKNNAGESGYSTYSSAGSATTSAAPSVPSAPTGVTATALSSSSISVSWNSISGISGYTVYVGTTSVDMTQSGTSTTASFNITGLTANTTYYIAVSASNAIGESSQSTPGTATTKLTAPAELNATPQAESDDTIQISWNAVDGAVSYRVYRSTSETGTYSLITTATGTSYDDTECDGFTWYYYKVSASASTSGSNEGELSDSVSARIIIAVQQYDITSFRFADFPVEGTINGTDITVTVPNIVNLTALVPTIAHNGKSISPESGVAQDFSSPIQYMVTAEDDTTQAYTVTVTATNIYLATALAWINSYYGSTRTFTIVVQSNETIAPTTVDPNYSNANIILKGGTTEKTFSLYNNSNGSLFTISYGTLTLDNNITLQGHSSNNASLVRLNYSSANLVMNAGSKIINNTVTQNDSDATGGGVNVGSGTFTMNGGTISGNRVEATSSSSSYDSSNVRAIGGGVYVNTGTFIMNDGTITNNTAYSEKFPSVGGGVFINSGTFTLVDGTISNNTADSRAVMADSYAYGGGVAAWDTGKFTMQGGTISGNKVISTTGILATAYYYGGGVYVRNDQFRKTGGIVYGSNASPTTLQNTAKNTSSGYAVYARVSSSTNFVRNATAGTAVRLDSSKAGSAGGWD